MWAEAEEAGGRGGSEEGSRQKRRQQGRQADGEAGSSRGGSEEGMTESRTVYLTDFQDFRALNGFPSFSMHSGLVCPELAQAIGNYLITQHR